MNGKRITLTDRELEEEPRAPRSTPWGAITKAMNEAAIKRIFLELLYTLCCAEVKTDRQPTEWTPLVLRLYTDPEAVLCELAERIRKRVAEL